MFNRLKKLVTEKRNHNLTINDPALLSRPNASQKEWAECEIGAMPPFGNLYGMEVFVDESLCEDEEIAFNAGSHTELIRLSYKDFEGLVKPKVVKFSPKK